MNYKDKVVITEWFYEWITGMIVWEIRKYYSDWYDVKYHIELESGDIIDKPESSLSLIK